MRRLVIPATLLVALVVASAAQASGLNLGTRNPTHGASKHATRIVGKLNGGVLQVRNVGGGAAFTFMSSGLLGGKILVGKGGSDARPFTTNAHGVATGLNADMLDGHDASDFVLKSAQTSAGPTGDFLPVGGKAADSNLLDGLDSTAFLGVHGTADNSNQLGGHPSSFFLSTTDTAADSDKLDGKDSTEFVAGSTRLTLTGSPFMDTGDTQSFPATSGLNFHVACADVGGNSTIQLSLNNTTGSDAHVASGLGSDAFPDTTVIAGDDALVMAEDLNTVATAGMTPFPLTVATESGTVFQGVVTMGVDFATHDCFISGSLSS
jgi:hypothetical protein